MEKAQSGRNAAAMRNMRLSALFTPGDVIPCVDGTDEDGIVDRLLEHLALEYGIGNLAAARAQVVAAMRKDAIHAGPGLAVVTARLERVDKPLVAIAASAAGVPFAGKNVHIIAAALAPQDMPGVNRQVLHALRRAVESESVAKSVAERNDGQAIWQHFSDRGNKLPAHLRARHIMTTPRVLLHGDDSLAAAIDLFLTHKLPELPVVNAEGELLGVVTTKRLVHVCLPEYLMWVEDMTPFLNFEPLAEIIRNDSSTWLKEIMVQDYAQVNEDAPAVLALKEIGSKETHRAYVLRGRQLVGVIHLYELLSAVLR